MALRDTIDVELLEDSVRRHSARQERESGNSLHCYIRKKVGGCGQERECSASANSVLRQLRDISFICCEGVRRRAAGHCYPGAKCHCQGYVHSAGYSEGKAKQRVHGGRVAMLEYGAGPLNEARIGVPKEGTRVQKARRRPVEVGGVAHLAEACERSSAETLPRGGRDQW